MLLSFSILLNIANIAGGVLCVNNSPAIIDITIIITNWVWISNITNINIEINIMVTYCNVI